MLEARESAECSNRGDRHSALHATQGLEGFDYRMETPGGDRFLECLCQTLEACGVLAHGADIFLANDVLGRCGTAHFREPPEVGCSPVGAARGADIVAEQEGCEPKLGGLEIPDGLFASPTQIPNGFRFNFGNITRGEIPWAHQAGQLHRVAAVGCDAVASFFREERWGHDPAFVTFFHEIPLAPRATGAGVIDKDQMLGLRLELAGALIDVSVPGTDGTKRDDFGTVILSNGGNCDGILVDIHTDIACARLLHGWPPSVWGWWCNIRWYWFDGS
jgi:hypothetical protein